MSFTLLLLATCTFNDRSCDKDTCTCNSRKYIWVLAPVFCGSMKSALTHYIWSLQLASTNDLALPHPCGCLVFIFATSGPTTATMENNSIFYTQHYHTGQVNCKSSQTIFPVIVGKLTKASIPPKNQLFRGIGSLECAINMAKSISRCSWNTLGQQMVAFIHVHSCICHNYILLFD